jgi:hypothetical protein
LPHEVHQNIGAEHNDYLDDYLVLLLNIGQVNQYISLSRVVKRLFGTYVYTFSVVVDR